MEGTPRLLVIFSAATLVVVGAIVALTTRSWWVLAVVFVLFLAALALVLTPIGQALRQGDKPDPVTEARLEEENEDDPGARGRAPEEPDGGARSRAT